MTDTPRPNPSVYVPATVIRITIEQCLNGVIVTAGCQKLAFSRREDERVIDLFRKWLEDAKSITQSIVAEHLDRLKQLGGVFLPSVPGGVPEEAANIGFQDAVRQLSTIAHEARVSERANSTPERR